MSCHNKTTSSLLTRPQETPEEENININQQNNLSRGSIYSLVLTLFTISHSLDLQMKFAPL